jgi:hypothetical protein
MTRRCIDLLRTEDTVETGAAERDDLGSSSQKFGMGQDFLLKE